MQLRALTMQQRSAEGSRRWLSDSHPNPVRMPPPETLAQYPKEKIAATERALRVTYQVCLPAVLRRGVSLGFGRCTLATEKGWDYYVSLGRDLGVWVEELLHWQDPIGRSLRRIEMNHVEDAATAVVDFVRRMPTPVRIVVEARACGVPWKRMTTELPDRAFFSLRDDWSSAVSAVLRDIPDVVRRIS